MSFSLSLLIVSNLAYTLISSVIIPLKMRRIFHYLKRYKQLSFREKLWFFASFSALGLARLFVLLLPFRFYSRLLGKGQGSAAFCLIADQQEQALAKLIGRNIQRAARFTAWRSKCLEQALVARCFCRYYHLPSVICLGLIKDDDGELLAHAWTSVGSITVTGGSLYRQFTPVSVFASC